jgi:hypothetical protein
MITYSIVLPTMSIGNTKKSHAELVSASIQEIPKQVQHDSDVLG